MAHVIKNIKPFIGQHCETTATGPLLSQIGVQFSEPMLFGLGEGLGFIFWNMKIKEGKLTIDIFLFKSIMIVVASVSAAFLLVSYFKKISTRYDCIDPDVRDADS